MTSNVETILRISKASWLDHESSQEAAEMVHTFLAQHPAERTFTTSALMRGMGVPVEAMTGFSRKLASARGLGMLEGYYEKGKPNIGTFGKPAIIWRGEGPIDLAAADAEIARRLKKAETC